MYRLRKATLTKHHGFKCTVVFGVNENGVIQPGMSNVPGIESLKSADLSGWETPIAPLAEQGVGHAGFAVRH